LPPIHRSEVEIKIGPSQIEGVELVVARTGVIDVFQLLRLKARMRIQAPVSVDDLAQTKLVLEVIEIVLPSRLDLVELGLLLLLAGFQSSLCLLLDALFDLVLDHRGIR